MKVALSCMRALRSSARSVTIQSIFRGNTAVSLEITCLLYKIYLLARKSSILPKSTYFGQRDLVQHVSGSLHSEEFSSDPYHVGAQSICR